MGSTKDSVYSQNEVLTVNDSPLWTREQVGVQVVKNVQCHTEAVDLSLFSIFHCLADQMMYFCIARMMRLSSCIASSGPWWHLWWACSLWSWPSVPRAWQSRQKPWRSASSLRREEACGKHSPEAASICTHLPAEPVSGAGDGRGSERSQRGSSLNGSSSSSRHDWKTWNLADCILCVVAMAQGGSS